MAMNPVITTGKSPVHPFWSRYPMDPAMIMNLRLWFPIRCNFGPEEEDEIHVVRCFEYNDIIHVNGKVDPKDSLYSQRKWLGNFIRAMYSLLGFQTPFTSGEKLQYMKILSLLALLLQQKRRRL